MAAKHVPNDRLFATTWVHVHEEDTAEGHVYRPEEDNIPLSRRPRKRLQLQADGSACISLPGADDGYVKEPATWRDESGAVVIRGEAGTEALSVVRQSPSRLLVRQSGGQAS